MRITVLTVEEVNEVMSPLGRRVQREQQMGPYREAVAQLGPENPGGVVTPDETETPRRAMMRLHRAARDAGRNIRFQRSGKQRAELRFRLQTPEETARLQERGRQLAQVRQAKRGPAF